MHIGHTVTFTIGGGATTVTKTFKILGSSETNPAAGIISYQSPVGAALLGHQVGDIVSVMNSGKQTSYTIIKIASL